MTTQTEQQTVTLTINGRPVTVPKGMVVVDAARTVDIEIPVFCYHQKLGPFGCCRMCLVEVEKMPKLATACTLQVADGMVVKTDSPKVEKAQRGVLEFTLLNHPLDCPVCDKGGECPLQDNTFKYGPPDTRMEFERFHRDKATPLSPVITIDRERCIACQRCTRYSDIIETDQALVMLNRGFRNIVGTFNDRPYDTRFSGNVIDICPVGALTNTDFRFSARSWELKNTETNCGHCGCNCNMILGARLNQMKRVTSQQRAHDAVDDGWICDKARWGYGFTRSRNRIAAPRKRGYSGPWTALEAAEEVARTLKSLVDQHGPRSVGYLGSPYALNEELYLYQKLFRLGLGTNNIDHKVYTDIPGLPVPQADLLDIESARYVLAVASDPAEELPILELRIKKAVTRLDVPLGLLNDQTITLDRFARARLRYNVGADAEALEALLAAVEGGQEPPDLESRTGLTGEALRGLAEELKQPGRLVVIYNPEALSARGVARIRQLLVRLAACEGVECRAMPAAPATNALGAMDMGVLPDYYPGGVSLQDAETIQQRFGENAPLEPGWSALEMIEKARSGELKALVVHRCNPVVDFPGGAAAIGEALGKLDLLVVHDILETETARLAHIVIPSNGPGYDEGTTTNMGGWVQWRKHGLVAGNPPDIQVLSAMLKVLEVEGHCAGPSAVNAEIADKVPGYQAISKKSVRKGGKPRQDIPSEERGTPPSQAMAGEGFALRVARVLFKHDKMLDAESPLAHRFQPATVHLHPDDAASLGIRDGDEVTVASGAAALKAQARVTGRCNRGGVVMPWVSDEQDLMALVPPGQTARVTLRR